MMVDEMQVPDKKIIAREALEIHLIKILEEEDLDGHTELILHEYETTGEYVRRHRDRHTLRNKVQMAYDGYTLDGERKMGYRHFIQGAKLAASWDRIRGFVELAGVPIPEIGILGGLGVELFVDFPLKGIYMYFYKKRTGDVEGVKMFIAKELMSLIPLVGPFKEMQKNIYPERVRYMFRKEANALYWRGRTPDLDLMVKDYSATRSKFLRSAQSAPAHVDIDSDPIDVKYLLGPAKDVTGPTEQ